MHPRLLGAWQACCDRHGWRCLAHHKKLPKFDHISLLFLPPVSPELNPMEQVWRQLRQDYLANRCFKDYEDIVDAICDAWNQFVSNVDAVKSLCYREWIII